MLTNSSSDMVRIAIAFSNSSISCLTCHTGGRLLSSLGKARLAGRVTMTCASSVSERQFRLLDTEVTFALPDLMRSRILASHSLTDFLWSASALSCATNCFCREASASVSAVISFTVLTLTLIGLLLLMSPLWLVREWATTLSHRFI